MTNFTIHEDDKRIIIALSSPNTYRLNTARMLKEIQKETSLYIIFICVNQPASFLQKSYGKNGIDINQIYFIDAITQYAIGTAPKNIENCKFVSKPGDLTSIGIAVTTILKEFEERKILVFLDSINAMLIHSSSLTLTKFIHFIINKLRIMSIAGILLVIENGVDPVLLTQLTSFTDDIIDFPEENVG